MLYGLNLLLCAIAWYILQTTIIRDQGANGALAKAVANDFKGKASPFFYVAGIATAWTLSAWGGMLFFVLVALVWLVPDRRVERVLQERPGKDAG
jgi:uncharacterized membrane protein